MQRLAMHDSFAGFGASHRESGFGAIHRGLGFGAIHRGSESVRLLILIVSKRFIFDVLMGRLQLHLAFFA
ncbi:MAG: hypothetical protein LBV73_29815 [Paraburkholderia sp.]|jgi:hypothetical protein|nr:hypothetical protein [Paraburkholderia sp.]